MPYLFLKSIKYLHNLAGRSSETIKKGTHAFIRHEKVRGERIRPYFKQVIPVAIATYPPRSLLAIYQQMCVFMRVGEKSSCCAMACIDQNRHPGIRPHEEKAGDVVRKSISPDAHAMLRDDFHDVA